MILTDATGGHGNFPDTTSSRSIEQEKNSSAISFPW